MNSEDVAGQLESIAASDDFVGQSYELTDRWSEAPEGFDAVEPILRFMESHPSLDYGMPGALVHFMETFFGKDYEQKLVESVRRYPTCHTLWMLNRLINGTPSTEPKQQLIEVMKEASTNPIAERDAQREATRFLGRLSS